MALRPGEKKRSWIVISSGAQRAVRVVPGGVKYLDLYPLPPWPLDGGCPQKGMSMGQATLQGWQTLQFLH